MKKALHFDQTKAMQHDNGTYIMCILFVLVSYTMKVLHFVVCMYLVAYTNFYGILTKIYVKQSLSYPNSFVLRILYCVRISEIVKWWQKSDLSSSLSPFNYC